MDPRFQPQNPQTHTGHPQNSPYYAPETHSNPNKYPTLPPAQNHQNPQYNHAPQQNYPHQPYPQQNFAPQSYPQENPYVKGHPGYVPPPQYGAAQGGAMHDGDSEKARLNGEMQELEKSLGSGHLQCYTVWSCIVAVVAFLAFVLFGFAFLASSEKVNLFIFLVGLSWLIVQSYFAFASVQSRNAAKATAACWMMVITLIPSLIGETIAIATFAYGRVHSSEETAGRVYSIILTLHLLVHIFVNLYGAFKVRKILMERAKIEMKLVENSFNNQA